MFNDRFAQLMALHFSGEATEKENRELQQFLEENPNAQFFYEVFSDYWTLESKENSNDIQDEIHFQQIIAIAEKETGSTPDPEETVKETASIYSFKRLLAAATFLGIIALSYFLLNQNSPVKQGQDALNEVVARRGTRSHLLLPDGSKVWLNADSKLEYRGNFNDTIREVYLEGEAFFDVVRDKSRPFIVHTSDLDIKVLGTAFNVKSYPKESVIEATLIHGLIEVTNKKEPTSPKVILRPHDKLVFRKSENTPSSQKESSATVSLKPFFITTLPKNLNDTAIAETSWIYNKLVFDGETFEEIAAEMERWYNVKITFRDKNIARLPIHVTFKDESIEEALQALQTIETFTYKIKGNEIEISK